MLQPQGVLSPCSEQAESCRKWHLLEWPSVRERQELVGPRMGELLGLFCAVPQDSSAVTEHWWPSEVGCSLTALSLPLPLVMGAPLNPLPPDPPLGVCSLRSPNRFNPNEAPSSSPSSQLLTWPHGCTGHNGGSPGSDLWQAGFKSNSVTYYLFKLINLPLWTSILHLERKTCS